MKRHKKNCREIAALLGYSHVTVRMWHAGHRPMADFAVKLLKLSLPR
jgi:DNA-binding transcriptional regulator YiaG